MFTKEMIDIHNKLLEIDKAMTNKSLTDEERDLLNEQFLSLEIELETLTGQW